MSAKNENNKCCLHFRPDQRPLLTIHSAYGLSLIRSTTDSDNILPTRWAAEVNVEN